MSSTADWTKYDFVKNALVGGALGAFASLFVPFLRPMKGALLGASVLVAFGVYRNLTSKSSAISKEESPSAQPSNVAAELAKFDELRKSGAITEEEFQQQKKRLLRT